MRRKSTSERNRKIFADYEAGQTPAQLAQANGLKRDTVTAIIGIERHRLEVSIEDFYERQRLSTDIENPIKS